MQTADVERQNLALKKYMDLNRFSSVIKHHLNGDLKSGAEMYAEIDLKNLTKKKRVLLELSPTLLKLLIRFQRVLVNIGLGNSVFR